MLRADLLVVAEALGHLGLLSAVRVAEIRSGQGHRDTANDLCALATLYDARPGTVYLVRPDGHVCGRWHTPDAATVRHALRVACCQ